MITMYTNGGYIKGSKLIILRSFLRRAAEDGGAVKLLGRYGGDIVKCFSTLSTP